MNYDPVIWQTGKEVERKALTMWEEFSGSRVAPLPPFSKFDAWVFPGGPMFPYRLEVKYRTCSWDEHQTVPIDDDLWNWINELHDLEKLKTVLLVVYDDRAIFLEMPYAYEKQGKPETKCHHLRKLDFREVDPHVFAKYFEH
jgi:hypothetical protein